MEPVLVRLARMTARAWYSDRQVVMMDILTQHQILKEEELAFLSKLNLHDVRKSVARLKVDKIVKTEYRGLPRKDGRVMHKIYYYIDYKSLYDSIKYRIWKIQKYFREKSQSERNERNYQCPRCLQTFSQLDVTQYRFGQEMLFRCPYHRPGENYFLDLEPERESESHVKLTRFMTCIQPLVDLLKVAESIKIPEYKPGASILADGSVAATGTMAQKSGLPKEAGSKQDKKGAAEDAGFYLPQQVVVEIHDSTESQLRAAREQEREKDAKRQQNALPIWHQMSTIVAEQGADGQQQQPGQPSDKKEASEAVRTAMDSFAEVMGEASVAEQKDQAEAGVSRKDALMAAGAAAGLPSLPGASITSPAGSMVMEPEDEEEESANIMDYYNSYYETYMQAADGEGDDEEQEEMTEVAQPAEKRQKVEDVKKEPEPQDDEDEDEEAFTEVS